jgi:hypothetical protein
MKRSSTRRLGLSEVVYILQSTSTNQQLAEELNVTRQSISLVRNGKSWRNIAPEIPRIPVRAAQTVRHDYLKNAKLCTNCVEYTNKGCSYGFPEAVNEPYFAAACHLYSRNTAGSD